MSGDPLYPTGIYLCFVMQLLVSFAAQWTPFQHRLTPTTQDWVAVVKRQRKTKPTTVVSDVQRSKATTSRREVRGPIIGNATEICIRVKCRKRHVFSKLAGLLLTHNVNNPLNWSELPVFHLHSARFG